LRGSEPVTATVMMHGSAVMVSPFSACYCLS
jgi:hypothetical protein